MTLAVVQPVEEQWPACVRAEAAIVGAVLLNGRIFADVGDLLSPGDFFHKTLGAIFAAFAAIAERRQPIDSVSVLAEMERTEQTFRLKAQGGASYLSQLVADVVTVENLDYYAQIVTEAAAQRRTEVACRAAADVAHRGEEGWQEVVEQSVLTATQGHSKATALHARDVLRSLLPEIEERHTKKQAVTGVPSGFGELDVMTAGFQPGDLIIVAGRPSMGKTSLAMNVMGNAAIEHKVPGLVFSLEMSAKALMERMLCSEARVASGRMRTGQMDKSDWTAVTRAMGRIAESPLSIVDAANLGVREIRSKARQWRSQNAGELALVVVDYVGLVRTEQSKGKSREQEVAEVSRAMKALAKDLALPVILLAQLNRDSEKRGGDNKRPTLADLRESGALEQDADVILFVYRDEVLNKQSTKKGLGEVIVGKQRNGAVGFVELAFDAPTTTFRNLQREEGQWHGAPPVDERAEGWR